MNKFTVFVAVLALLFITAFAGVYWKIRDIDPEGACKDLRNFSLCQDAWRNHMPSWTFQKLPTDQKMIDNFKRYRTDFDGMLNKAWHQLSVSISFDASSTERSLFGVYQGYSLAPWIPAIYSSPDFEYPTNPREFAWQFDVASTLYMRVQKSIGPGLIG